MRNVTTITLSRGVKSQIEAVRLYPEESWDRLLLRLVKCYNVVQNKIKEKNKNTNTNQEQRFQ